MILVLFLSNFIGVLIFLRRGKNSFIDFKFLMPRIEIFPVCDENHRGFIMVIKMSNLEFVSKESGLEMIRSCEASMKAVLNKKIETRVKKLGNEVISEAVITCRLFTRNIYKVNAMLRAVYADITRTLTGIPLQGVRLRLWGWKTKRIPHINGFSRIRVIDMLNELTLNKRIIRRLHMV